MKKTLSKLNITTWKHNKVIDGDVFDTEIGDSKQPDFKPQVKIKRWDNECNFSVRLKEDDTEIPTISEVSKIIKYKKKDYEARMYEKEDGFEFEVEFDKKPKSNIVEFTIETKGLDFFYQPELTQEEKDEGASRPDNVIGSYAVYHSTKKDHKIGEKNYKTGKVCHIYRPEAHDKNGVKRWCDMEIKNGKLTVTVPQDYLDTAEYPVIVDPTLGYTTMGGSLITICRTIVSLQHNRDGLHYTASENGTITSLSAAVVSQLGTQTCDLFIAVNEKDSGGSGSHDLIASTELANESIGTSASWHSQNASGNMIDGEDYIINTMCNGDDLDATNFVEVAFDATGSRLFWQVINTDVGGYATLRDEDPWVDDSASADVTLSLYVTYTANISKINAIATSGMSKIHGVTKANISKVNGLTI